MLQVFMESKPIKIIYGKVLPLVVVILLLGVASFNNRIKIEPNILDLLIRLLICFWFGGLYFRLSRISSYSIYPNIKWSKTDVGKVEKIYLHGLIILFSLGCAFITLWTIRRFLPLNDNLTNAIALINGLLVFVPLVANYWVIKV